MSTEEAEKVQAVIAEGVAREGLQEMVLPAEEAAAERLAAFLTVTSPAVPRTADARRAQYADCVSGSSFQLSCLA